MGMPPCRFFRLVMIGIISKIYRFGRVDRALPVEGMRSSVKSVMGTVYELFKLKAEARKPHRVTRFRSGAACEPWPGAPGAPMAGRTLDS